MYSQLDVNGIKNLRSDTPKRPHNPADVYYRQTRPDIYNNIGMVNENGEKWKELRHQLTPPLTTTPQNYASQICQIIDDFVDVLDVQADTSAGLITGFLHQVRDHSLMTSYKKRVGSRSNFGAVKKSVEMPCNN